MFRCPSKRVLSVKLEYEILILHKILTKVANNFATVYTKIIICLQSFKLFANPEKNSNIKPGKFSFFLLEIYLICCYLIFCRGTNTNFVIHCELRHGATHILLYMYIYTYNKTLHRCLWLIRLINCLNSLEIKSIHLV